MISLVNWNDKNKYGGGLKVGHEGLSIISFGNWNDDNKYGGGLEVGHEGLGGGGGVVEGEELPGR